MEMREKSYSYLAAGLLAVSASQFALSQTITLDFDVDGFGEEIVHGQVVDNEYANLGVEIYGVNQGGGPDRSVAYSSTGMGRDSDLEANFSGGNAANTTGAEAGNLLIIQENNTGCGDGICDQPDDEGSRPAGELYIDFNRAIESTSFDLIDVEQVETTGASLSLLDEDRMVIEGSELTFESLGQQNGATFGDNFYNTISTIFFDALNLTKEVFGLKFDLGGSGAINNVSATYTAVPEFDASTAPISLALLGGILALRREKNRRKK